jgi:hypothetical protein
MQRHSQSHKRKPRDKSGGRRSGAGFLDAWARLVGPEGVPTLPTRRGRKPRVPLTQLLPALTFHVMQGAGTLADHFVALFGESLADSSWSDRRSRLPWEIFADLMRRALRPLATRRHRDAFWRDWRLVALDGTQFSLGNTPQVLAERPKSRTRRGRAAFAKLTTAVLLEIGLHNPLAAAIGRQGESEWALAHRLLAHLPKRALLLADRLYGCAAFAVEARTACERVGSHFLVRVRTHIKPQVRQRLADGSRLVRVAVRERRGRSYHLVGWLDIREIRVRVRREGQRGREVRLWTTLLDPATAPALELAQLYARRWEHELYYREVKRQLRRSDLLQSHTVDTGCQEIAALILASALLARERASAATGHVPALRVSFAKVLHVVQSMWLFLGVFEDLISERQKDQIVRRGQRLIRTSLTAPRRSRSCPRAVRQPIKGWPRLLKNESNERPVHFSVR